MAKEPKTIFACAKCGAQFSKWSGRCGECGAWGSLEEEDVFKGDKEERKTILAKPAEIIDLKSLEASKQKRYSLHWPEIDKVLGGGLVPGSLLLFSGEPGVGKSTLVSQIASNLSQNQQVFYVSGEESASQVKERLERLNCGLDKLKFVNETNTDKIISLLSSAKPEVVIIDSIQTVYTTLAESEAGSLNQIRASAALFLEIAKRLSITIILIGHITKDGQIAGPKTLEHMVDTVLYLERDISNNYVILKSSKNRFGSVNEIGLLEMTRQGFKEVKDGASAFIEESNLHIPGSIITATAEGSRVFLLDVQALVSKTVFGYPQRKASGFDLNRLQVLSAVINKRTKINLSSSDIILNIAGGFKVSDTSLDLAVSLAIISSFLDIKIGRDIIAIGELGLGGEIRAVNQLEARLKTASELGFKTALVPQSQLKQIKDKLLKIKVLGLNELKDAVEIIKKGA
ncbi:MAG: DNA repair protein RadA [Candidatus Pacebacteria bacterium]|nr:DNA repair protein RadA [Candidatus Paceibacterota bacterium]